MRLDTTTDFSYACRKLGIDLVRASEALHDAKAHAGLKPNDDCEFQLETGDILFGGEVIGNLGD